MNTKNDTHGIIQFVWNCKKYQIVWIKSSGAQFSIEIVSPVLEIPIMEIDGLMTLLSLQWIFHNWSPTHLYTESSSSTCFYLLDHAEQSANGRWPHLWNISSHRLWDISVQCMKWPVAHSPNSTWFWLELVGNCCERLKIIMECTNIQFCERLGHGWQFHPLSVHENHWSHRTFLMARTKCPIRFHKFE